MKKYIYQGDGAGIPGLPREISEEEINQFNPEQAQTWSDLLAAGAYVEVKVEAEQTESPRAVKPRKSAPTDEGAST